MTIISGKQSTAELIFTFLDRLTEEDWEYCIEQNIYSVQEAKDRKQGLRYLVTGLLLMYMNRMHPESYVLFLEDVESQLNFVLDNSNELTCGKQQDI